MPDLKSTRHRLKKFADWTGTVAPKSILDDEGAPTEEFRDYARREGLCLDWVFCNSERSLALGYRRAYASTAPSNVQERVRVLATAAGIDPVEVKSEDGEVILTDELIRFCADAHGDPDWLFQGKITNLLEADRKGRKQQKKLLEGYRKLSEGEQKALVVALEIANSEEASIDEALEAYRKVVEGARAA